LLHKLLSKNTFYFGGLLWGVAGIGLAGLLYARREHASEVLPTSIRMDMSYHYHTSAVGAAVLAVLLLIALGSRKLRAHRHESLGHLFGALIAYDIIALLLAAAFVFVIGWGKEIADAMQGKFIDSSDVYANFQGIMRHTLAAGALLLPVHTLLMIAGDSVRRSLLRAVCPPAARPSLVRAQTIQGEIQQNRRRLHHDQRALRTLEQEIRGLETELFALKPDQRAGPAGQGILERLATKRQGAEDMAARIGLLETENQRLRNELQLLQARLQTQAGAEFVAEEVDHLLGQSLQTTKLAAEARGRIQRVVETVAATAHTCAPGSLPAAGASAAPILAPASPTATSPADAGAPPAPALSPLALAEIPPAALAAPAASAPRAQPATLREAQRQLEVRTEQVRQMEETIGTLHAELDQARMRLLETDSGKAEALTACVDLLKRRVLIVDDDRRLLELMRRIVHVEGTVEVTAVTSAPEAVQALKQSAQPPDLIILDIRMPGTSGLELSAALERTQKLRYIPVIFCSGCPKDSVHELSNLHYVDYIQKPFRPETFRQQVFHALRLDVQALDNLTGGLAEA